MIYFTADTHFGDERLNLYQRDLIASSAKEIDDLIIKNWNDIVKDEDTIYHLGDFTTKKEFLPIANQLNGYKILIKGNYDDQFTDEELLRYFNEVYENRLVKGYYLNHYPNKGSMNYFNLVGHIHGLWKVQRNMINVGCDAWHFKPISLERINFTKNAIIKHFDDNVFAGGLECNLKTIER